MTMGKPIIRKVHPTAVVDVMKRFGTMVIDSLATAGETDFRACVVDFVVGRRQLWTIIDPDNPTPLAFFRTEIIVDDEDGPWICLSALAGKGMWRWARKLSDQMAAVAKEQGCKTVCFAGRKAWGRILPECEVVGEIGGNVLYERAAL